MYANCCEGADTLEFMTSFVVCRQTQYLFCSRLWSSLSSPSMQPLGRALFSMTLTLDLALLYIPGQRRERWTSSQQDIIGTINRAIECGNGQTVARLSQIRQHVCFQTPTPALWSSADGSRPAMADRAQQRVRQRRISLNLFPSLHFSTRSWRDSALSVGNLKLVLPSRFTQ